MRLRDLERGWPRYTVVKSLLCGLKSVGGGALCRLYFAVLLFICRVRFKGVEEVVIVSGKKVRLLAVV